MTLLSVVRLECSLASLDRWMYRLYIGNEIDSRMRIKLMTTTISISVKPRAFDLNLTIICQLPVFVLRVVESRAFRFGIHVEDVLATPRLGSGIVLHGTHAPLCFSSHRINRNLAEKPELLAANVDASDESVEIRRILFAAYLGLKCAAVGRVFISVDGITQHPEVVTKFALALALDADAKQRNRQRTQNDQNRSGDDQLDQRKTALTGGKACLPTRGQRRINNCGHLYSDI